MNVCLCLCLTQCDQMMELKVAQFFPNIAQNVSKSFLHESCDIWNWPKIYQNIWATFLKKYYQEVKK